MLCDRARIQARSDRPETMPFYLTRPPKGPGCHNGKWRAASNVQDNEGTSEASKKGKEGGQESNEGRQDGRFVECSAEGAVFLVNAAPKSKSLDATDCLAYRPQWLGHGALVSADRAPTRSAAH